MKKVLLTLLILLLSLAVISCSNTDSQTSNTDSQTNGGAVAPSLKNDFYEAVNFNEINSWQIADDASSVSIFSKLMDKNYDLVQEIIVSTYNSNPDVSKKDEYNIAALYETAYDYDARNNGGYGKLNECITKFDNAADLNSLLKASFECDRNYITGPAITVGYTPDLLDSTKYTYYSSVHYGLEKERWLSSNTIYVDAFTKYLKSILTLNGTSELDADNIINDVTAVMKDIASVSLSIEELSNPKFIYNPKSLTEFAGMLNNTVSVEDIKTIYGITNDSAKIIVQDVKALKKLATYLTEDNLELLKNYMKICLYLTYSECATIAHENAYIEYKKSTEGLKEYSLEKDINTNLQMILEYELGKKYYEKYFTADMQKDILSMIDEIKKIYERRINNLIWMSTATKEKAINKLKVMKSSVGVSQTDIWPQDLLNYTFTRKADGGLYIDNVVEYRRANNDYFMNETATGNPVNNNIMPVSPQTVNAFYSPNSNTIMILPGIAQSPVYSIYNSKEENLGGIGTIIAHEITHAFDSNGAFFDEFGNIGQSWWTEADLTAYNELQQKTINYYNGYKINNMNVNGTLTLSENIADLGAVSCVTEYAKNNHYNLQALYIAYARIWAIKARPEYLASQLLIDNHAPGKIRANAVLSATDDFYTAFDIKETDGMYKPKEERPSIW